MLADSPNNLACSAFDFVRHVAAYRKLAEIWHVDHGGDHADVVALPESAVVVHDGPHRHVVGEHPTGESFDAVDPGGHGKRGDQEGTDPAALVGVGDGERDLGDGGIVIVSNEAGVGNRVAVLLGHHPHEVVDIVDLGQVLHQRRAGN